MQSSSPRLGWIVRLSSWNWHCVVFQLWLYSLLSSPSKCKSTKGSVCLVSHSATNCNYKTYKSVHISVGLILCIVSWSFSAQCYWLATNFDVSIAKLKKTKLPSIQTCEAKQHYSFSLQILKICTRKTFRQHKFVCNFHVNLNLQDSLCYYTHTHSYCQVNTSS